MVWFVVRRGRLVIPLRAFNHCCRCCQGPKMKKNTKKKQEKYCPWQTQTKISSQNAGKDKRYKNSKQQQTDWCCEGQIDKQKNRRRKIFCENLGTDSTDALQLKSILVSLFRCCFLILPHSRRYSWPPLCSRPQSWFIPSARRLTKPCF